MALFAAILAICDSVPVAPELYLSSSRVGVRNHAERVRIWLQIILPLSRYPAPIWLGTRRDLPQPEHWVELTGASAFMHLLIARTPGLWHHENRLAAGLDIGV
jgi:hypothetical protein